MKKLNELKAKKNDTIAKMEMIAKAETLTEEARTEWSNLDEEVKRLEGEIAIAQRLEEINKSKVVESRDTRIIEENKPVSLQFRDWLKDAHSQGKTSSFFYNTEERADPILTSTTSAIINKTVANSMDILTSPAEAFLRQLGVTFYPGLVGNFVIPSMAQDTAAFYAENADASWGNMLPEALTLAARRVSHTQSISKETLAQTNPAIYAGILQNLVNGVWNAVTNDVFDTLQTDAATSVYTPPTSFAYSDLVNMEASIGGLNIGAGAYVTTPSVKAYLKNLNAAGANIKFVWSDNNQVNGYPAYGVPAANANKVYFGDFSKMAVGQWGGLEIVVDPYTNAKKGLIDLTVIGLFDTGCINKRGLVFTTDVSAAF